jgi:hypothetical protein
MKKEEAKKNIPLIHAQAAVYLPGLKQARTSLEALIRVLEYFDEHATRDTVTGVFTPLPPPPASLMKDVEEFRSILSLFGKLHQTSS